MKTIQIQIQPGSDTSTFDIYTDSDSYTNPIHFNISKNELINGYTSTIVPDNATIIKVSSNSIICPDQFILIPITTTEASTQNIFYPILNGTWGRNTTEPYLTCINSSLATSIYEGSSYDKGPISCNKLRSMFNINRYYTKFNISELTSNGITSSNISSIKFKFYMETSFIYSTIGVNLTLFECGIELVSGNDSQYGRYRTDSQLITYPNIPIGNVTIIDSGYYEIDLNSYGLSVINQRITNNQNFTLSLVMSIDAGSIEPTDLSEPIGLPQRYTIYYKSILGTDVTKYPHINIVTL